RAGKKAPGCRGIATAALDDAVARVLLDALTPEQVALALAAAGQVTGQHQRARPVSPRRRVTAAAGQRCCLLAAYRRQPAFGESVSKLARAQLLADIANL